MRSQKNAETAIREYAERLIETADKSRLYNPAGGEVTVKALSPIPHVGQKLHKGIF